MGRDIDTTVFTREDRLRYREKVKTDLAALRGARLVTAVAARMQMSDASATMVVVCDETE